MGRWATRSPDHDPTLPLSAASLMLSFRTMLDRKRAEGMDVTIGIRLTADAFRLRLNRDGLTVRRGELEGVDAVLARRTDGNRGRGLWGPAFAGR